jgi:hypothetical protein
VLADEVLHEHGMSSAGCAGRISTGMTSAGRTIFLERAVGHHLARSRFVAQSRAVHLLAALQPSGSNSRSCSTRRGTGIGLTCRFRPGGSCCRPRARISLSCPWWRR